MLLQKGNPLSACPPQRRPQPFVPCRQPSAQLQVWRATRSTQRCQATKTDGSATQYKPKDARDAIETATRLQKEQKDYAEAVRLYLQAMEMKPSEDEARAALYNMGCALAKQKHWAQATECVMRAINDYNLKLVVALKVRFDTLRRPMRAAAEAAAAATGHRAPTLALSSLWLVSACPLQDDDLRELRDRREWLDALMEVKGGMSRETKIDLRAEAKVRMVPRQ